MGKNISKEKMSEFKEASKGKCMYKTLPHTPSLSTTHPPTHPHS